MSLDATSPPRANSVADAVAAYATRGLNPYRLKAIRGYAGKSIVDVGCGNGVYVLALAGEREITGVDYKAFETWKQRPELFSIGDAASLNIADSSVDTVLSFETLEHLNNPERALREYHRVCRKNLILTVPNCDITPGMRASNLLYSHWSDHTHVNFFNMQTLVTAVRQAGFRIKHCEFINPLNPWPFLMETLGLSGSLLRALSRAFRYFPYKRRYISCLLVAEK